MINESSEVGVGHKISKESSDWVVIAEDEQGHLLLVFLRIIFFVSKSLIVVLGLLFLLSFLISLLSLLRVEVFGIDVLILNLLLSGTTVHVV